VNAGESGKVDLDLLADYVGGALEGTAEERTVARLIAEDAQWAQAYAQLARDVDGVRLALAEWGAEPAAMPPDVADRLSAGLAAAVAGFDRTAGHRDEPIGSGARPGPTRPPNRPEGESARPVGRTSRRRLPRWATPVAIVAALVAVAGLGVSQLTGDTHATNDATSFSGGATQPQSAQGEAAVPQRASTEPSADRVLTTGTDYTRRSLVTQVPGAGEKLSAKSPEASPAPALPPVTTGGSAYSESAPGDRAARQITLADCLQAIANQYGRGTPRFLVVDYARFEGRTALIVVFADADGQRWAWAVAPECGQPQVGAAALYTARVG
jgi:hypothetical protein